MQHNGEREPTLVSPGLTQGVFLSNQRTSPCGCLNVMLEKPGKADACHNVNVAHRKGSLEALEGLGRVNPFPAEQRNTLTV